MLLTAEQLNALRFEALTDPRTIKRIYDGEPVKALARARVERAARKLGVQPPPMPRADAGVRAK